MQRMHARQALRVWNSGMPGKRSRVTMWGVQELSLPENCRRPRKKRHLAAPMPGSLFPRRIRHAGKDFLPQGGKSVHTPCRRKYQDKDFAGAMTMFLSSASHAPKFRLETCVSYPCLLPRQNAEKGRFRGRFRAIFGVWSWSKCLLPAGRDRYASRHKMTTPIICWK